MKLGPWLKCLQALDRHSPSFEWQTERAQAFLQMGRFLEENIRAGQPGDLKNGSTSKLWQSVESRLLNALRDAESAPDTKGELRVWQMYNSGALIKDGPVLMGFDLLPIPRVFGWKEPAGLTERMADMVDILFVTHRHGDHYDRALVGACLDRERPVCLPDAIAADWEGRAHVVRFPNDKDRRLRGVSIRGRAGTHVWRAHYEELPLICFEVTGPSGLTIIHGGDIDYTREFEKSPNRQIALFFLPWRAPNSLYENGHPDRIADLIDAVKIALDRVQPEYMLYGHCAELEHVYDLFPASYDMALDMKKSLPVKSELLFWGEEIVIPGTKSV